VTTTPGVVGEPARAVTPGERLFGITTDTLPTKDKEFKKLTDRIDAVKLSGGRRPVVRVNIDPDDRDDLDHYRRSVAELKRHAGVMVNLADSHDMYHYPTAEAYKQMVGIYLNALAPDVDIWEIGNEVNGEWAGWQTDDDGNVLLGGRKIPIAQMDDTLLRDKRKLVGEQVAAALDAVHDYEKAKQMDLKVALTLYYNDDQSGSASGHCWEKPEYEMFDWAGKHLDPVKDDLDYVFISFYEGKRDCPILKNNLEEDGRTWARVFGKLAKIFSPDNPQKGNLGFGEFAPQCDECKDNRKCGTCKAAQLDFVPRYYATYDKAVRDAGIPKYVGGFFYWYFYQDAVRSKDGRTLDALKSAALLY
jgi:hypothetical protein